MSALIIPKYVRGFPPATRVLLVNSDSIFANHHAQSRATTTTTTTTTTISSCTGLLRRRRRRQGPQHWNFRPVFCSRRHVSTYLRQSHARVLPGKFSDHTHSPQVKEQHPEEQQPKEEQEIMQVTWKSFEVQRPKIIERLRKSMFVAFDFEFSGLGKARDGSKRPSSRSRGNQTLQECYSNLRETAETYQVLQVGLCPVEWSKEHNAYIASPVNIFVSPAVKPASLGVDRVFSLQSSTLSFLHTHGFDFNTLLRHGVPYLSREEEQNILNSGQGTREPFTIDQSEQKFAEDCIKALEEWENDPNAPWDFINITTDRNDMTKYQKAIVHQIVRTRFPKLQCQGKDTFICVTRASGEPVSRNEELDLAIGLRHVIDELFNPQKPDGSKHVLVGHNCFLDLLHLYNCFIGKLPQSVVEFAELIHKSFPIIVDTKYFATFGDKSTAASSASTLRALESLLQFQTNPKINFHPEYNHYSGEENAFHEAGYDSYVTATIMVRLAARLAHEGGWKLTPLQQLGERGAQDKRRKVLAPPKRDIASEAKDYVPLLRTDCEKKPKKNNNNNNNNNMELDDVKMEESGLKGVGNLEVQQVVFQQQHHHNHQQQHRQGPVSFLSLGPGENEKFLDDVYRIPGFFNEEGQFWKPYVNCLRVYDYSEGIFRLGGGSER